MAMTHAEARKLANRIVHLGHKPTEDEVESFVQAFIALDGRFNGLRSGVMDALDISMEGI